MFWPRDYRPWVLSANLDLKHVATSAFLRHCAHSTMVPSVGHSFVNSRVNRDQHTLALAVIPKEAPKGDFPSVSGFSSEDSPTFVANAMGSFQDQRLRTRVNGKPRFCIYFFLLVVGF